MNNIGYMYEEAVGVPQDYKAALDWYYKSAELGWGAAMWNLGLMYANGKGVDVDYNEALRWVIKAKESGDKGIEGKVDEEITWLENMGANVSG